MTVQHIAWNWRGAEVCVGADRRGTRPALLPAMISITTHDEMRALQERLATDFATVAIDWPGFGDEPRPRIARPPAASQAFLEYVLARVAKFPFATLVARHSANHVLHSAALGSADKLFLIAPTWRGPLPTLLSSHRWLGHALVRAGDLPLLGQMLYRLDINRAMVRMMTRAHVYVDPDWLSGPRLREKMALVGTSGARHATLRFVGGMLDPLPDRAALIVTAECARDPILALYGAATPSKFKAEMQALAALTEVQGIELPAAKLAVHEKFADAVAETVKSFLDGAGLSSGGRGMGSTADRPPPEEIPAGQRVGGSRCNGALGSAFALRHAPCQIARFISQPARDTAPRGRTASPQQGLTPFKSIGKGNNECNPQAAARRTHHRALHRWQRQPRRRTNAAHIGRTAVAGGAGECCRVRDALRTVA